MLQSCPDAVYRILKRGGSLLLAAKILVLSRLLHKKTAANLGVAAFVEKLRMRLGKLRQKLLNAIDQRMANVNIGSSSLVDAMCAFSLATSSSCADVLRHFHYIRLNAVINGLQNESSSDATDAVQCLKLWVRTMQDTQALFPRQISNALAKLKSRSLLRDDSLRNVQDFDLETHDLWMDEEIKNFVPYVRHDDLNVTNAAHSLSTWAPSALKTYVSGLKDVLATVSDFQAIFQLRQNCLHQWLNSKGLSIGISKSEGLDLLRAAFQERLQELLKVQSKSIKTTLIAVHEALENWYAGGTKDKPPVLWHDSLIRAEVSHGAQRLIRMIDDNFHGRSGGMAHVIETYRTWLKEVNAMRIAIANSKSERWEPEDLDEEEDDPDDLEDMKYRLEKEDSNELESGLKKCIQDSIYDLQTGVALEKEKLKQSQASVEHMTFLLRITREMKQQLPEGVRATDADFSFVQDLQRLIATPLTQRVLDEYRSAIAKAATQLTTPGRILWDGEPELPVVPSPWSYRLLKFLHSVLSELGSDIWTANAVNELKEHFRQSLANELDRAETQQIRSQDAQQPSQFKDDNSVVNGETGDQEYQRESINGTNLSRDSQVQLLFDVQYLSAALLGTEVANDDALDSYCELLRNKLELSKDLASRIDSASRNYWKRTSLLFALLAQK